MSQDTQDQELYHKIIEKFQITLKEEIKFEENDKHQLRALNFQYDDKNPKVIESVTFPSNFNLLANILTKAYHKNVNPKSPEEIKEGDSNSSGSFPDDGTFQSNAKDEKHRNVSQQVPKSSSESEDEEEEEITVFKMKSSDFEAAKAYFYETEYYSLFNNVKDFEFQAPSGDLKRKELLDKLKDLKTLPIKPEILDSISLFENTKVIRLKEKMVLVGPSAEVKAVERKIHSMIRNDEMGMTLQGEKDTEDNYPTHGAPSYGGARAKDVTRETTENTRQKNQFPVKNTTNEIIIGKRNMYSLNDTTLYIGCTGLEIYVHIADITKLRVDCIVNAANRHLRHGGGVAHVISKAAGYDLQYECERYIEENKSVPVTGVFVSTGGDLPAKHVIHAVGPRWDDYDYSDKKKCTDDLRRTVLTCLLEATKMKMSTIALPSISAAIFRVPQDLCAEAYVHAVKNYDAIVHYMNLTALKEIHFVDINDTMIDTIQNYFTKQWLIEKQFKFYQEDLTFSAAYMKKQSQASQILRENLSKQDYRGKQNGAIVRSHADKIGKVNHKAEENKSSPSRKHSVGTTLEYSFEVNQVKLTASATHAFDFNPDLVIVVGDPFDKLSGHSEFKASNLNLIHTDKKIKNIETFTSTMKDKKPIYVFELTTDEFSVEKLKNCFHKLHPTIALSEQRVTSLVITSKFLYPDKTQKVPDLKCFGTFAQLVYEYAKSTSVKLVTVTTSEDVYPHILKVFQSRETDQSAPGAYPYKQSNVSPKARALPKSSRPGEKSQKISSQNVKPSQSRSTKNNHSGKNHK